MLLCVCHTAIKSKKYINQSINHHSSLPKSTPVLLSTAGENLPTSGSGAHLCEALMLPVIFPCVPGKALLCSSWDCFKVLFSKFIPWEHSFLHSYEMTSPPLLRKRCHLKEIPLGSRHTCYTPPATLPSSFLLPSSIILFPGYHLFRPLERSNSSVLKCINKFMLPSAKYKDLIILFHSIPQRIWNVSVLVPFENPSVFCVLERLEESVEHHVNIRCI